MVTSVAFSPDGRRLVSLVGDGTVRVWNTDTSQILTVRTSNAPDKGVGAALSADGEVVARASKDGTVRLWDTDTGQPVSRPLTGHTGEVGFMAFSRDGHRLATVGDDNTVRLLGHRLRPTPRSPARRSQPSQRTSAD